MMPTDDHQPDRVPPPDQDADRLQMQHEARFLRCLLAIAIVWSAFELTRLADRIAGLLNTTP